VGRGRERLEHAPVGVTMEVRPGGAFRVTLINDEEGTEMTTEGVYREVVEPELLVIDEPAEGACHDGAVSEVTLGDLGDGRSDMVVKTTIQKRDEMRRNVETGLAGSIDRLAEILESR
jgi:uncharacterized protein YndB with AHSA1/START domain